MPVAVAIYDKAATEIGDRLGALGLDLEVVTFDRSGSYCRGGLDAAPEDVDLDYLWLSSLIYGDGFQQGAFELALRTRRIGVLQTYNAGLDDPFYRHMAAKGTRISSSSAQAVAISEYVLGQLLAILQPIEEQRRLQARREWRITPFREIAGTRWLIVGYGPIGREIARKAKVFGAHTTVVRRSPATGPDVDAAGRLADLPRFLAESDIVVLACPLNAETRGLAGDRFFAALKPGAILVNIARGGLVDERAMLAALDCGTLAAAMLDVFHSEPLAQDSPLWAHPGVRLTAHTSFAGSGVKQRWDALFLENIGRFARGEPLLNEVDPRELG